ncbi:MAG: carboxypeptidase regulatory-like domain-containing protein [Crocinitomicaceae bacterium]|nr:carboxypeptidase regulatory-like domain-containing protein [Crocinitomicaceae bacterium]
MKMEQTTMGEIKKYTILHFLLLAFLFLNFAVFAQDRKVAKAESYYAAHRYFAASNIYNELIQKDKLDAGSFPDVYRHGAESDIKTKQYDQAKYALEFLSGTDQFTFEDAYRYIQLMIFLGRVEDARAMYAHRVMSESIDPKKANLITYFETPYLEGMKADSLRYIILLAPFNSDLGDFSPTYHPKGIAFTSARNQTMETPWSVENTAFLTQYLYDKNTQQVNKYKGIKGKKHDGVAFHDSIDSIMYYSKNLKRNKKLPVINVGIFIYNEKTKKEEAFAFNEPTLFTAHPSLSNDRKTLWFTSNRDGGKGGLDIWYSVKNDNGWSQPVNAGDKVNTSGDEMFPYERNNKLYFSSNGHMGLGGLDLFTAEINQGEVLTVVNSGYPLNSNGDDFSLIIDVNDTVGFFSSNRGDQIDRIYTVTIRDVKIELHAKVVSNNDEHTPIAGARVIMKDENDQILDTLYTDAEGKFTFNGKPERQYKLDIDSPEYESMKEVFGTIGAAKSEIVDKEYTMNEKQVSFYSTITDIETGKTVPGAIVDIKDLVTGKIISVVADDSGKIYANIPRNKDFQVTVTKPGYDPTTTKLTTKNIGKEFNKDITIRKTSDNMAIRLDNILYDYNKYNLSKVGRSELDTLVMFLKENRAITVEISSHTDCRGTDEYNMKLSQQRGQSCMNYLVQSGIKKDRLLIKNYGETRLLNQCDDGVECSEELHQVNRRTEFVLVFPK